MLSTIEQLESGRKPRGKNLRKLARYGDLRCWSWKGDYDELDRPMKDGELYRPGVRTCGHSDCISPEHIVSDSAEVAA